MFHPHPHPRGQEDAEHVCVEDAVLPLPWVLSRSSLPGLCERPASRAQAPGTGEDWVGGVGAGHGLDAPQAVGGVLVGRGPISGRKGGLQGTGGG